jgi:probable rRNA maturation factor
MKRNFLKNFKKGLKNPTPPVTIVRRTGAMRIPRKRLAALTGFVLRAEKAKLREVEIVVVDDKEMKALNRTYHHVRGTTDVLSFNLADPGEPICAEIIICADEAVRQARQRRERPQREFLLYVVHGLLHLLGYDDTTLPKSKKMATRQDTLLAEFHRTQKRI